MNRDRDATPIKRAKPARSRPDELESSPEVDRGAKVSGTRGEGNNLSSESPRPSCPSAASVAPSRRRNVFETAASSLAEADPALPKPGQSASEPTPPGAVVDHVAGAGEDTKRLPKRGRPRRARNSAKLPRRTAKRRDQASAAGDALQAACAAPSAPMASAPSEPAAARRAHIRKRSPGAAAALGALAAVALTTGYVIANSPKPEAADDTALASGGRAASAGAGRGGIDRKPPLADPAEPAPSDHRKAATGRQQGGAGTAEAPAAAPQPASSPTPAAATPPPAPASLTPPAAATSPPPGAPPASAPSAAEEFAP